MTDRSLNRVVRAPLALATALLAAAGSPAAGDDFVRPGERSGWAIDFYAAPFIAHQYPNGGYALPLQVQPHLKSEIAMALAAQATGNSAYAESARRDLDWVIANRLESSGGLNWYGPEADHFFECHQHWFLIASEMIRRLDPGDAELRHLQRKVWRYLIDGNPAREDFYLHNLEHHGVFFAYRSIDRQGRFQTQAPFKGSYEVGAALWSLALHYDSGWLNASPGGGDTFSTRDYLRELVQQSLRHPDEHGFYDPEKGIWIRSILWNGIAWSGYEPRDWKYVLHMQEGALLYSLLTGRGEMIDAIRDELDILLPRVRSDGTIDGIPDPFGSPIYEYGEALTVLGLAADLFLDIDPSLHLRCLSAGDRVARFCIRSFAPTTSEGNAMLLAGLCRLDLAHGRTREWTASLMEVPGGAPRLAVFPNPIRTSGTIQWSGAAGEPARIRILDAGGRTRALLDPRASSLGRIVWDGLDEGRRPLPNGRYLALVESGRERQIASFIVLR